MQTIQQAISESMKLIASIEEGALGKAEITNKVSALFDNELSARGFMAALGSSKVKLSEESYAGLLEGLKEHKDIAYDLLVKNIIMSSSASLTHEENGKEDMRVSSEEVTARCLDIARALNDVKLNAKVEEVLAAIHTFEQDPVAKHDTHAMWFDFFERWGYEGRHLSAAKKHVMSLLGK